MATRSADAVELYTGEWYLPRGGELIGLCRECWQPRPGASWSGRCLDCHEATLVPVGPEGVEESGETWSDLFIGTDHDE